MTNQLAHTAKPVREWTSVTRDVFENEIKPLHQPAVLRGVVSDWPVIEAGREGHEALAHYLRPLSLEKPVGSFMAAPEHKGRFFYGEDLRSFNFARQEMRLSELLAALLDYAKQDNAPSLYAGAVNIPAHMPAFTEQNKMSLLGDEVERLASIWIGNRTRIPPHWDLPSNIACVAAGRRQFTLFPMEEIDNLYIGPLDFTLAGQPCSLVDLHKPDLERFPRFRQAAEQALFAELEPGDAIYIPSLWVHHVESLDSLGVLVNFWWREGPPHLITLTLTLLHAILSLREMPSEERQQWKIVFDHYIFDQDEETLAHIPENARGALQTMTPEINTWLRSTLSNALKR